MQVLWVIAIAFHLSVVEVSQKWKLYSGNYLLFLPFPAYMFGFEFI